MPPINNEAFFTTLEYRINMVDSYNRTRANKGHRHKSKMILLGTGCGHEPRAASIQKILFEVFNLWLKNVKLFQTVTN